MKQIFYVTLLSCALHSSPLFAWNALGHRLVAQIAYDNLTADVKRKFNRDNRALNYHHKSYGLVNASVWMDQLYSQDFKSLKPMHYIDLPYTTDGSALPKPGKVNAVYAITMASRVLSNSDATDLDKAIAVRILWHVVGDIHQPLHAATQVSQQYPQGDRGGNLVRLRNNAVARNLHAYWDKGAGVLSSKPRYSQNDVKQMAANIEQQWPCDPAVMNRNPMDWANESHELAIKEAYTLPADGMPDTTYQQKVSRITIQQIALAGCRLAAFSEQTAYAVMPLKNVE
ncbi:MAG: S1/P1 nuclease [Legionellaceae bacterium]|nr:S1/P1 nuclease [Legionellaceae bacterium]